LWIIKMIEGYSQEINACVIDRARLYQS